MNAAAARAHTSKSFLALTFGMIIGSTSVHLWLNSDVKAQEESARIKFEKFKQTENKIAEDNKPKSSSS
ncbi:hypothetical protein HK098_000038 [Nowakowskiella sp. JEL0407]|nr:hypothetical protein HK098_000038 [Nowakowskiella sp. JEL0407]